MVSIFIYRTLTCWKSDTKQHPGNAERLLGIAFVILLVLLCRLNLHLKQDRPMVGYIWLHDPTLDHFVALRQHDEINTCAWEVAWECGYTLGINVIAAMALKCMKKMCYRITQAFGAAIKITADNRAIAWLDIHLINNILNNAINLL